MEHEITVAQLRTLLQQLQATDRLIPNRVSNLAIVRDGECIGYIDLLVGLQQITFYNREPINT